MAEEIKAVGKIYQRMMNVMKKIEYLAKDDTIAYKTVKYKGLSEEKVTKAVREQLVEQNIIVYPIKQEHSRVDDLSTVDITYRFVCVDDGSYIEAVSSGTGVDTKDKGVGKAMTYAYKYLWLRTFAIPTGEDPDKISSAELDDNEKTHCVAKGKTAILQLIEDNPDLSDDFKTATITDTDVAVSKDDVDMLEIIYKEVTSEIRKGFAPEQKANTEKAAREAAKKYNHEPPLPEGKPAKSELDAPEQDLF